MADKTVLEKLDEVSCLLAGDGADFCFVRDTFVFVFERGLRRLCLHSSSPPRQHTACFLADERETQCERVWCAHGRDFGGQWFFSDDTGVEQFVEEFAKKNKDVFDLEAEEHKLEYTEVYKDFQDQFEKKIEVISAWLLG